MSLRVVRRTTPILALVLSLLPALVAAQARRELALVPVCSGGVVLPEAEDAVERLATVQMVRGQRVIPGSQVAARLQAALYPRVTSGAVDGERLVDAMEQGMAAFVTNRFDAAVRLLELVRAKLPALLPDLPDARERFFHAMMILGRSLDALDRGEEALGVYRWLVARFPEQVVDTGTYPPSLVRRYQTVAEDALARTGALVIQAAGVAPVHPESCTVYLDGVPRAGLLEPGIRVVEGRYRCRLVCEEGITSRDYRCEVEIGGRAVVTMYLGQDRALSWTDGGPCLELEDPWDTAGVPGPASALAHLVDVDHVVVVSPVPGGGLELVMVPADEPDRLGRITLREEAAVSLDEPEPVLAALMGAMVESPSRRTTASVPAQWPYPWFALGASAFAAVATVSLGLAYEDSVSAFNACRDDPPCAAQRDELQARRDVAARYEVALNAGIALTATAALTAGILWLVEPSSTGALEPTVMGSGGDTLWAGWWETTAGDPLVIELPGFAPLLTGVHSGLVRPHLGQAHEPDRARVP